MTRASSLATVVFVGLLALSADALADRSHAFDAVPAMAPLTSDERAALSSRQLVARPLRFDRGRSGRYVGGVSYQVMRAEPREVLSALANAESLPQALPSTESATMVSRDGTTARVELVQGKSPFLARYTIVLEQAEGGNAIRFWLDPTRPHDIKDVWGFFRVDSFGEGRTLVTVAAAIDLGPGLARALFEDRVQRTILRAPTRIRAFIEPLSLAAAR